MKRNVLGMTLVEVVVSMAILALTIAVSFAAISFSLNILNRAETVNSEYADALEEMADKLDGSFENDKNVHIYIDGEDKGDAAFNKIKTDSKDIIGSFYYYALK